MKPRTCPAAATRTVFLLLLSSLPGAFIHGVERDRCQDVFSSSPATAATKTMSSAVAAANDPAHLIRHCSPLRSISVSLRDQDSGMGLTEKDILWRTWSHLRGIPVTHHPFFRRPPTLEQFRELPAPRNFFDLDQYLYVLVIVRKESFLAEISLVDGIAGNRDNRVIWGNGTAGEHGSDAESVLRGLEKLVEEFATKYIDANKYLCSSSVRVRLKDSEDRATDKKPAAEERRNDESEQDHEPQDLQRTERQSDGSDIPKVVDQERPAMPIPIPGVGRHESDATIDS